MFDNTKMSMKVNMTGKEYMEYRESRKSKLSKNDKQAIISFSLSALGILMLILLINDLTYVEPEPMQTQWSMIKPTLMSASWNDISKSLVLIYAPLITFMVLIAWLIHGVGFFIIKG